MRPMAFLKSSKHEEKTDHKKTFEWDKKRSEDIFYSFFEKRYHFLDNFLEFFNDF
jgi:hypothetical protein